MLILVIAFGVAVLAQRYLQAYAPSNAIVARVRQERPGLRVAAGLLVLSAALGFSAISLAGWVASGGPGWLNLMVLIAIWDCLKFLFLALTVSLHCAVTTLKNVTALDAHDSAATPGRGRRGAVGQFAAEASRVSCVTSATSRPTTPGPSVLGRRSRHR